MALLTAERSTLMICMVLSGETKLDDLAGYDYKPTYIIDSIKELPALLEKI